MTLVYDWNRLAIVRNNTSWPCNRSCDLSSAHMRIKNIYNTTVPVRINTHCKALTCHSGDVTSSVESRYHHRFVDTGHNGLFKVCSIRSLAKNWLLCWSAFIISVYRYCIAMLHTIIQLLASSPLHPWERAHVCHARLCMHPH